MVLVYVVKAANILTANIGRNFSLRASSLREFFNRRVKKCLFLLSKKSDFFHLSFTFIHVHQLFLQFFTKFFVFFHNFRVFWWLFPNFLAEKVWKKSIFLLSFSECFQVFLSGFKFFWMVSSFSECFQVFLNGFKFFWVKAS